MKHDTIFASLGKTEDENGEAIGSHAYYLVKLAQEKAELKDTTAVLKKKIKKEFRVNMKQFLRLARAHFVDLVRKMIS